MRIVKVTHQGTTRYVRVDDPRIRSKQLLQIAFRWVYNRRENHISEVLDNTESFNVEEIPQAASDILLTYQ